MAASNAPLLSGFPPKFRISEPTPAKSPDAGPTAVPSQPSPDTRQVEDPIASPGHATESGPLTLSRLQWTQVLQRLHDTPQAYDFQLSLLHLVSWPSLTHLPEDLQPTVARICALLARRPTTGSLLPVLLGRSEARVFPLIEALRLCGHLQAGGAHPARVTAPPEADVAPASRPPAQSLLGQLWQRLHFHV